MAGGSRKAKNDISPMMRHAFAKGIGIVARKKGLTIPELVATWIDEDWKAVVNAMGKFAVREKQVSGNVNHDHTHEHTHRSVSETDKWIESVVGIGEESPPEKSMSH